MRKQTNLKYKSSSYALAPNVRNEFRDIETKLFAADMGILEGNELKNNLEAYAYEMRSNIDQYGSLEKYVDPQTKELFLKEINDVVEWLYNDGQSANKEEYRTKLAYFKQIGDPIRKRQSYYTELEVYYGQLDKIGEDI